MGIGLGIGRGHAPKSEPTLWLLQDEFATDLAAGSVNGTAAEPGPGTRTVVDTAGDKVYISSGSLAINGANSWNDTYISYASVGAWTAGRVLLTRILSTGGESLVGFIRENWDDGVVLFGDHLRAWNPHQYIIPTTLGYWHDLAIVTRASGHFLFLRRYGETTWALRWMRNNGLSATMPVSVQAASGALYVSHLRIPAALWLPTPLASDGFGSAFGTTDGLGHAEGIAGGIGAGGSGVSWSNAGNTWSTSGGKAINTAPSGLSQQMSVFEAGTSGVLASAALTRSAGSVGLALSMDSASNPTNGVLVYLDGTNCKVDKIVAGSTSNVRTTAVTYSSGKSLVVAKAGTEYRVYYNDALVGAANTISDAGIVSNTLHGLFSTDASNTLDNFTCYATGTGGEYAELDKWS